jgi:hypothetical protein
MKLNFNFNLVNLDGEELKDANAGKVLANALIQQTKGDAIKIWEIALSLNKGDIVDLDSSDQELIKNFIKETDTLNVIAKGQLLPVFNKE